MEPRLIPAFLPLYLEPRNGAPLVRIRQEGDGGYVIDSRNIKHADILISMGINDDWSFEEDFYTRNPIPIQAYDASVSAWDFFLRFYIKLALFEPVNAKAAFHLWRRFKRFFDQTSRIHHPEFVGRDEGGRDISLATLLARDIDDTYRNIFFKIDIEHSEYWLLDTLVSIADRIEGLVIEFHSIDRNLKRLEAFINAFPLTLCHVHANNCAQVLDDGLPIVIECSFTRHPCNSRDPVVLPHPLDLPCCCSVDDIAVSFGSPLQTRPE
jgi:hypothetical protein